MKLGETGGHAFYHSVRGSTTPLLKASLTGEGDCSRNVIACLGPIYENDPAAEVMAPFYRSLREIGVIDPEEVSLHAVAPDPVLRRAHEKRWKWVEWWENEMSPQELADAVDWTRAGLVLEIASRLGIPLREGTKAHVRWRMRGTVTGRFGVESGGFNPLVIPRDQRRRVVPDGPDRSIVALDFRAMDLCSMLSLFTALRPRYEGTTDLHERTAELVGVNRDVAKKELFVYAYGGHSSYEREFQRALPELDPLRGPDLAREIQKRSATAFKAGLSRALPLLFNGEVRPLFAVHDELTLDALSERLDDAAGVAKAMEQGASDRMGVAYSVGMQVGRSYEEAKR